MDNQISSNLNPPQSDSSDSIAMILEIVFGLFGIMGVGWLYAGNIPVAILIFVGFIIIAIIEMLIGSITLGLAACLIIPFNLVVAIISGLKARDYVRNSGATGSALYVVVGILVGVAVICGGLTLIFGGISALGSVLNY